MRRDHVAVAVAFGASPASAAFPWIPVPFVKQPEKSTWTPPRETSKVEANAAMANAWSPRPTGRPLLGQMELVRRLDGFTMNSNTCGFVASSWSDPFTCVNSLASCTNDGTYFGCCDDKDCKAMKTKCFNYAASSAGSCALPTDYHTVCCSTSLFPECFTYLFSTTATPGSTFTLFGCDRITGVGTLLDYPPEFTRVGGTISSSAKSQAPITASSTQTETAKPSPTPNDDDEDGGGTNVPAIVGGTVGGLAALGAVGLLAFYFLIRRKKKPTDAQPPPSTHSPGQMMAQIPPQTPHTPGSSHYPMSPGSFQTQQSYNAQGYDQGQGYAQQGYPPQTYQAYAPSSMQPPTPYSNLSVSPSQQMSPAVPPQMVPGQTAVVPGQNQVLPYATANTPPGVGGGKPAAIPMELDSTNVPHGGRRAELG